MNDIMPINVGCRLRGEARPSFLKKEAKNFYPSRYLRGLLSYEGAKASIKANKAKVFWSFFSKKDCLLPGTYAHRGPLKKAISPGYREHRQSSFNDSFSYAVSNH